MVPPCACASPVTTIRAEGHADVGEGAAKVASLGKVDKAAKQAVSDQMGRAESHLVLVFPAHRPAVRKAARQRMGQTGLPAEAETANSAAIQVAVVTRM
jgi:hypothetical protein